MFSGAIYGGMNGRSSPRLLCCVRPKRKCEVASVATIAIPTMNIGSFTVSEFRARESSGKQLPVTLRYVGWALCMCGCPAAMTPPS